MTRFATRLTAGTAAFCLAALPGVATAQDTAVDEETGPVAFANAVGLHVDGGGSFISETQRSPLRTGKSQLAQSRSAVPSDGNGAFDWSRYQIHLGNYGDEKELFPPGVSSREHRVVAKLAESTVPSASAEANYALLVGERRATSADREPVLVLEGARTSADCTAPDDVTATTTADRLQIREKETWSPRELPAVGESVTIEDLPVGPPHDVLRGDPAKATSHVTISRITSFDDLMRQEQWRSGDVTAVAGWQLEIVTEVPLAPVDDLGKNSESQTTTPTSTTGPVPTTDEKSKVDVFKTRIVLGGVSCSLPGDFTAVTPRSDPGPAVPVRIPAGTATAAAAAEGSTVYWGVGLLGGGALLGAAAFVVARRRTGHRW